MNKADIIRFFIWNYKFPFNGQLHISRNNVISDIVPAFFVYYSENSAGIWIVWSEYYICLCN